MEFIKISPKQIPIYNRSEVVVVGGGVAGLSAAVASARLGAKTILVELGNCLGGTVTKGLTATMMGVDLRVNKGFFAEFLRALKDSGYLVEGFHSPNDPEAFKSLALDFVEKEGVELLFHTMVIDVLRDRNKVSGIVMANKSGLQAIMGEVFIDASGDADVAALAGEAFEKMKLGENALTLIFRVGDVDVHKFATFVKDHPDEFMPWGSSQDVSIMGPDKDKPLISVDGLKGMIKKARENGELYLSHDLIFLKFLPTKGTAQINATHVTNRDPVNAKDLTLAEIECRKQMMSVFSFMKNNVPGFEDSFLMDSASHIGVRESRRVIGEYVLTEENIRESRRFDDAVTLNFMPIDIHGPGEKQTWGKLKQPYQIPYRSLQAKVNENLLIAGRCISTDRITQGSTRSVPCCFGTGQAAGVAAALSVREKRSPKKINIGHLQSELKKQGVRLS